MMLTIDLEAGRVTVEREGCRLTYPLSEAWHRCAGETKYVYTFTWLGRPVIQLPDDLLRAQEAVHAVQPDVVIETGVAHGGSVVFYASLCKLIGRDRVIGIDAEIRPGNRRALESHPLAPYFALVVRPLALALGQDCGLLRVVVSDGGWTEATRDVR